MALTGTIRVLTNLTNTQSLDLSTPRDDIAVELASTLTSGTGANQANSVFTDRRTLASSATDDLDVYDFGGTRDALGQVFTNARVKAIIVYNRASTAGENIRVGGNGTSAAFNVPFNASDDASVVVGPGGVLAMINPSAAGWAVADSTNHLLRITNAGAGSIDYDVIIVGANA